jgi:hypothetical protein
MNQSVTDIKGILVQASIAQPSIVQPCIIKFLSDYLKTQAGIFNVVE